MGVSIMDWLMEIAKSLGVPVAVLVAVFVAIWKAGSWTGKEIVIPIRDVVISKFVNLIEKVENTLERVEATITRVDSNLEEMTTSMEKRNSVLSHLETAAKSTADTVAREHAICHNSHTVMHTTMENLIQDLKAVKETTEDIASFCPIVQQQQHHQSQQKGIILSTGVSVIPSPSQSNEGTK